MSRAGLLALLLISAGAAEAHQDGFARQRAQMVATIRNIAATSGVPGQRQISPAVLDAMRRIPRHLFVPKEQRSSAYENRPLAIGHNQTISQPYIVALMTDLLRPERDDVVLEVGAGSGYQAAVLSGLVRHVYTIEIVEPLARDAQARLRALGYRNVTVRHGDGYAGWPEHGPFEGIIVTAGARRVPQPLLDQLKPGGRMVIPVGSTWTGQKLLLIERDADGRLRTRNMGAVLFVPMTGAGRQR